MRQRVRRFGALLIAAGLVAACSQDPTAPGANGSDPAGSDPAGGDPAGDVSAQLSVDEIDGLVLQIDLMSEAFMTQQVEQMGSPTASTSYLASFPPGDLDLEFSLTRDCFISGSVLIEGTVSRTVDSDAGHVVVDAAGTKTHDHCTLARRYGEGIDDPETITITGNPGIDITLHREWDLGTGMGMGMGMMTRHYLGGFLWERSNGDSGECELDLTIVVDPENGLRTAQGEVCGEVVDKSWPWPWEWPTPGNGG